MKTKKMFNEEVMRRVVDEAFTGNLIDWASNSLDGNYCNYESKTDLYIYDHKFNWKLIDYKTKKVFNSIYESYLYVDEYKGKLVFRAEDIWSYDDGRVNHSYKRITSRNHPEHYKYFNYNEPCGKYIFNKETMDEILK